MPYGTVNADLMTTSDGVSSSGLYGFKNRIINGAMAIDQRNAGAAVAPTSASITYCLDRWYTASGSAASGTLAVQRVATSLPGSNQYCMRIARTAGTYAGTLYAGQAVETNNCYDLAGKTITVSFQARAGSAYSASTIGVNVYTGTAADQGAAGGVAGTWTGWASLGSATFSPTTSFATYSATFTVGANVQEMLVNIITGSFSGSGSANDYVEITGVQLEKGSTATSFDYRPYGTELQLCQRYACCSFPSGTAWAQNAGTAGAFSYIVMVGGTSAGFGISMPFPVAMRASPTVTYYNPSAANDKWRNTIANADSASGAAVNIRTWGTQITNYQVAGDVASQTCQVHWSATAEL